MKYENVYMYMHIFTQSNLSHSMRAVSTKIKGAANFLTFWFALWQHHHHIGLSQPKSWNLKFFSLLEKHIIESNPFIPADLIIIQRENKDSRRIIWLSQNKVCKSLNGTLSQTLNSQNNHFYSNLRTPLRSFFFPYFR